MLSRFRAALSRVLVPRACSVYGYAPRLTSSLAVTGSGPLPSGSSAMLSSNGASSIEQRTVTDMNSVMPVEFGKQFVDEWIKLYPLVKEAVDKWTDADQRAVAKHVLRYPSQAIPMSKVQCKDLVFSRPTVHAMLSKLVIDCWCKWTFFRGRSATGKTMGMHYFVRDMIRVPGKDRLCVPVTCHLQLRELDTEDKCKHALAEAMGLDPASDSVKKRSARALLQLLMATFEQLKKLHFTDSFICPIFWIDDVDLCHRSFVTDLCATIVDFCGTPAIMTSSVSSDQNSDEFLKFLTSHSGTSRRLSCSRFPVVTEQEIVDFLQRLKDKPVSKSYQTFYDVHGVATERKHEYFCDFKVSDAGIRMLAHHFRDRFDFLDDALDEIQKESKKGNVDDAFVKELINSVARSNQHMTIFSNVFSSGAMIEDPELYFTAVELFDALEKSQGDSVEFLGHERRRVAKLCELNCLTRDLDDGYFGSLLVTSGVGCVQFKSRILSLTWSVFKQIPGAIEQQRIAADKSRAAAQAAEADRKAQLKAAEEASEEAAEARRKAAEEGTLTQWNAAVAKSEIASALWKAVVEAGEARCAGRQV